ncbi:Uncharacterized protein ESCO_006844 [Escovopsis weberi]|uniref:Carbonic anhydrase n=1 Tax=Escovopsis weberi TaxID=150374 RepID=A0A0M8MXE5_ESCWE|nr:Uncharacterized protein ESCO_006844 [Escovopsis weberi]
MALDKMPADPQLGDGDGQKASPQAARLFVLTCIDPRLEPLNFGVEPGSAYVCRNAGGRACEALRSIIVSQQYLSTDEIMVVHHTDCGMTKFTDQDIRDKIEQELKADGTHIAFLGMKTPWQSVKLDVQFLRDSPLVRNVPISGYVYDVASKRLHKVC